MHHLIDAFVDIAQQAKNAADRQSIISEALKVLLTQKLSQYGCQLPQTEVDDLLRSDIILNAQGLIHWLDNPTERFKRI